MRLASRFRASARGGAAILTALAAPPILLVALGAIQLNSVVTDKQKTQDVADSAALWGAQQLTVTKVGADERTTAFANAQLEVIRANATVRVTTTLLEGTAIKVSIDTNRPSFFMNMMPLGGFDTHVEAIAEGASLSPLCVLIIGGSTSHNIHMTESSKLQGPACMVHSNHAVLADGSALIQAQTVEASTTASGPISPAASTGAPAIDDPFAQLSYNFPGLCLLSILDQNVNSNLALAAGVHQFNYKISGNATLTLQPGDHYFCGDIELKSGAKLFGDDVAIVLGPFSKVSFKDGSDVNLNGRKSGALAGFVMLASRNMTSDLTIYADPITNITGTIYSPNAKLIVDGSKKSGTSSAWTVLAVEEFEGKGGANLVINANYGGTDVPVPSGVGNKVGETHLTR